MVDTLSFVAPRFKFDPDIVREMLFPGSNDGASSEGERDRRPRKRRRKTIDEDCTRSPPLTGKQDGLGSKGLLLENDVDRYLLSAECAQEVDVNDTGFGSRQYKISLFPREDSIRTQSGEGSQESRQHDDDVSMNEADEKLPMKEPDSIAGTTTIQESSTRLAELDLHTETNLNSQSIDMDEAGKTNNAALMPPKPIVPHDNNDDTPPTASTALKASNTPTHAVEVPKQDIACELGQGDLLFVPDGIRIARGKIIGDPPGDEAYSKVDWFMKVTRWKWRDPPREGGL